MDITRQVKNNEFVYLKNGHVITNKIVLNRISKLHVPPKWKNVKISSNETDYLQTTGIDIKGRMQYIYHPLWVELSKIEKYNRLKLFAERLPLLIRTINKKLSQPIDLDDKDYIIAVIFRIMTQTHSRIGNDHFAEENNTYGLTTLLKKHVLIDGNVVNISFVGKKNVKQHFVFTDKVCSTILKNLLKLPGERLFKTKYEEIKSCDINVFLKDVMGDDFTAKDFRTHAANDLFMKLLVSKTNANPPDGVTKTKKIINECYDQVSSELGNTRAVCKTSYVMPIIAENYLKDPIQFVSKNKKLEDVFKMY